MAGSYSHLTEDDGSLRRDEGGRLDASLIDNMGDAFEAIEELAGMVWWLTQGDQGRIEDARQQYPEGLRIAGIRPWGLTS